MTDKIKTLINKGEVEAANQMYWKVKAFQQKVLAFLQEKGLTAMSTIPEFLLFSCSEVHALEIPAMFEGFKMLTDDAVACGVGLDWPEASKAMRRSRQTRKIELYDNEVMKAEDDLFDLQQPVNISDPKTHEYEDNIVEEKPKFISAPDAQQQMQIEQQFMQAQAAQMMPQQPQQQPQQAQPVEGDAPRKSLLETLTGQRPPEKQKEEPTKKEEMPEQEDDKSHMNQIGEALISIKQQIPQLMDLAERNPDAFKQTMTLVQKLLSIAKTKVKKSEHSEMEDLVKKINSHMKYPVGTTKGRKKKIVIRQNGQERTVWRSMASGQVMDDQGNPISVKQHNREVKQKEQ